MSIQALFSYLSQYSFVISIYFLIVPVLGWLLGRLYAKSKSRFLSAALSSLIYGACIPGMMALVLVGYALFFTRENLLNVNAILYFLPIISLVATLTLVSKNVRFSTLPGLDRLSGLMVLIAVVFVILLALYKTHILVGFFGSLQSLLLIAVVLFFVLNWAMKRAFR